MFSYLAQSRNMNSGERLAAANVFVLPSVIDPEGGMDNLPTVIMEAMATGLPVVSTRHRRDSRNGH